MTDYIDINDVLRTTNEVLVIDLLEHALHLEYDPYMISLKDPQPGIYLAGSVDPIIKGNTDYYYRSSLLNDKTKILNFEDILNTNEVIVDKDNKIIITPSDIKQKKKYLSLEPTVPSMAIKLAREVAIIFLNSLCKHTKINIERTDLSKYIKEEYHNLIETEAFESELEKLWLDILKFVNSDTWNIYFIKSKNTTLIIEKSIDYRIYDWYRIKFEKEETDNSL